MWNISSPLHTDKSFLILLNQTEIRLCLPFSDWFKTKRTFVWFQINRKIIYTNLISVKFNKISKIILCICGNFPTIRRTNDPRGKRFSLSRVPKQAPPLKALKHHCNKISRGSRGSSIRLPSCQLAQDSRVADEKIPSEKKFSAVGETSISRHNGGKN